jgi:hypothetical protein
MDFRTIVEVPGFPFKLNHRDSIFLAGSCFAERMQHYFHRSGFSTFSNSHGIIFDPNSLGTALKDVLDGRIYQENNLEIKGDEFVSLRHHGSFSSPSKQNLLETINTKITQANYYLKKVNYCFITFGNAYAFIDVKDNQPVANCHRLPTQRFARKMLSVKEIVALWKPLLSEILDFNQEIQMVFTVSPVRYLKDGAINNQISKANLLLAVHELCSLSGRIHYFPSYELMMDDLREYRFYANDMIHPSELAQSYIWERLQQASMNESTISIANQIAELMLITDHRPRNPEAFSQHLSEMRTRLKELLSVSNSAQQIDSLIP